MKCEKTILVVDDDVSVLSLLTLALSGFGYRVLQATSGAEALAAWENHGRSVDLLLTDVNMPVMTGSEVAHALEARQPGLKVLYMSGGVEESAAKREPGKQAGGFIAKPFHLRTLADSIRVAIAG